ncbi:MAG: replication protein [Dehalococcoidia bacterium]
MDSARDGYRFEGFAEPNYTQIPDVFFDEVMCHLTEAELRVALYIMRRTFGFKKRADAISFNQFLKGITTRDGRRLDHGCGIAGRTNLTRALKGLEDKGLITAIRSMSAKGDAQTTVYELRFKESGVVSLRDHPHPRVVPEQDHPPKSVVPAHDYPGDRGSPPVVMERDLQETEQQSTENKRTVISTENDTTRLMQVVDAVSEALGESRKKPSNRSRAARILEGISEDYAAYIAELALGRVQTIVSTQGGVKNRMAYYFGVLEDMARQAQGATTTVPRRETLAGRYDHLVRR